LLSQTSSWHRSFAPLLANSLTVDGSWTFVPAAVLHIQALLNDLMLQDQDTHELSPAGMAEWSVTARSIISYSRRLAHHPGFFKGFVVDRGILPALATVLMQSWDMDLKKEACEVVRSMIPRREGCWDSRIVHETGQKMLVKEEESRRESNEMINPQTWCGYYEPPGLDNEMLDFWLLNNDLGQTENPISTDGIIDPQLLNDQNYGLKSSVEQDKMSSSSAGVRARSVDPELVKQFLGLQT